MGLKHINAINVLTEIASAGITALDALDDEWIAYSARLARAGIPLIRIVGKHHKPVKTGGASARSSCRVSIAAGRHQLEPDIRDLSTPIQQHAPLISNAQRCTGEKIRGRVKPVRAKRQGVCIAGG